MSKVVTNIDWAVVFKKVEPFVVQVISAGSAGTGFLFSQDRRTVGIATAFHVIKQAYEKFLPIRIISMFSKKEVDTVVGRRSISTDKEMDAAIIFFQRGLLPFPLDPLPVQEKTKILKVGIEIGWCGYPNIEPDTLCFFSGRVSARIPNKRSYLVDGVAINGVSGGPAFSITEEDGDEMKPKLRGMVTDYIPNPEFRAKNIYLPGLSMIRSIYSSIDLVENRRTVSKLLAEEYEKYIRAKK